MYKFVLFYFHSVNFIQLLIRQSLVVMNSSTFFLFRKVFTFEGHLYWFWILDRFYFHSKFFRLCHPILFLAQSFQVRNPPIVLQVSCLCIFSCFSADFKNYFLSLENLIILCLPVALFQLKLFEIFWTLLIWVFLSLPRFEKFSTSIALDIIYVPLSFLLNFHKCKYCGFFF